VRLVVPKPGIVTPIIFLRDKPNLSKVLTQTSKASVESNPPEIPITAVLAPVCTRRCASPATCIEKTSSQRSFNAAPCGTNGCLLNVRVRFSSLLFTNSVAIRIGFLSAGIFPLLAANVVLIRRSARRYSTSISLIINCSSKLKRSLCANWLPFS